MKVSLIKPPAIQSITRGAGFYGENLKNSLKEFPEIEIVDHGEDLTHYLYFDPFFLTLPPIRNHKTVVTVFDLIPLVLPNLYPSGIRGNIKWQIQKNILKTVDHIITISQSAKKDIIKIVGIPENKITVTYLAAGSECKKLNLPKENFVLYIGDINPNKNLSTLFKAVALLKDEKLVMVGKALAQSEEIKKEIEDLGISNRVTLTGYVDEKDKVNFINKAKVLVQPSIYEGFGLPVLEALSCGTPVICGRNSSMEEVGGDAVTYTDVEDVNDLFLKIKNIKIDSGRGQNDIKAGMMQAAKFSWEKTAKETIKVYEKVLA